MVHNNEDQNGAKVNVTDWHKITRNAKTMKIIS